MRPRGRASGSVRAAAGALVLVLGALPAPARAQTDDAGAVIGAAQALFDALEARDADAMLAVMTPNSFVISMRDGALSHSTGEAFAEGLRGLQVIPIERMWNPEVRIDGDVAQLWARYDVYVDGEFSHCGYDAFHMVRLEGVWKIAGVTYSVARPPACETHPEGPPGR